MKRFYLLLIFLFVVLVGLGWFKVRQNLSNVEIGLKLISTNNENKVSEQNYNHKLKVGEKEILVEIADTAEKQKQGLSGREKLDNGTGMLFIYPTPQFVSFWMPDMNFAIDIIFIRDNKIVEILNSVPNYPKDFPKDKLPRYSSKEKVDMVLEVPAGWGEENGIKIGDSVSFR